MSTDDKAALTNVARAHGAQVGMATGTVWFSPYGWEKFCDVLIKGRQQEQEQTQQELKTRDALISQLREQRDVQDKLLESQREELAKLHAFFDEVAELTANHDGLSDGENIDIAVVYPNKLGRALEKVDPNWHDTVKRYPGYPTDDAPEAPDDEMHAAVDLAGKMLEQLGQALGDLRNARTKLEQMMVRHVSRTSDLDRPDYVRGYDAGFIVGAEKGKAREPDAYITNEDVDELRLKHRCHAAFLTDYGTGGSTEVFFGKRLGPDCEPVEPPTLEEIAEIQRREIKRPPREVPKRGDELRKAAFQAGADWARKTEPPVPALIGAALTQIEKFDAYMRHNYPDAKGDGVFERAINVLEGLDTELGMQDVKRAHAHGAKFIRNAALEEAALIAEGDEFYGSAAQWRLVEAIRRLKT